MSPGRFEANEQRIEQMMADHRQPCRLCGSTRSQKYIRRDRDGTIKSLTCENLKSCERRRFPPIKYVHANGDTSHSIWRGAGDMFPWCHRCGTPLVPAA